MYAILNGLFVTLLCALKQMKQVFGEGFWVGFFFFFLLMGVLGVGGEEKKIIITHAVHQGTQTSL